LSREPLCAFTRLSHFLLGTIRGSPSWDDDAPDRCFDVEELPTLLIDNAAAAEQGFPEALCYLDAFREVLFGWQRIHNLGIAWVAELAITRLHRWWESGLSDKSIESELTELPGLPVPTMPVFEGGGKQHHFWASREHCVTLEEAIDYRKQMVGIERQPTSEIARALGSLWWERIPKDKRYQFRQTVLPDEMPSELRTEVEVRIPLVFPKHLGMSWSEFTASAESEARRCTTREVRKALRRLKSASESQDWRDIQIIDFVWLVRRIVGRQTCESIRDQLRKTHAASEKTISARTLKLAKYLDLTGQLRA